MIKKLIVLLIFVMIVVAMLAKFAITQLPTIDSGQSIDILGHDEQITVLSCNKQTLTLSNNGTTFLFYSVDNPKLKITATYPADNSNTVKLSAENGDICGYTKIQINLAASENPNGKELPLAVLEY